MGRAIIMGICCKRSWRLSLRASRCLGLPHRNRFCGSPPRPEKPASNGPNEPTKSQKCGNDRSSAWERLRQDVITFMWEIEAVISSRSCVSAKSKGVAFWCACNTIGAWTCGWIKPRGPCLQRPAVMEANVQLPRSRCAISPEEVRSWPERGQQVVELDGNQKRKRREARLSLSWGTLRL